MKANYFDALKLIAQQSFPLYIISGDEAYQQHQLCEKLLKRYQTQDYEIVRYYIDGHNYDVLYQQADTLSLFSSQRFVIIHFNKAPDKKGQSALVDNLSQQNGDDVYLLVFHELNHASTKTKWFNALAQSALHIQLWPLGVQDTVKMIDHELSQVYPHMQISLEAKMILAQKTEGNMLATHQILELLARQNKPHYDADNILPLLHQHCKYDVFDLIEPIISGNARKALNILNQLLQEGTETVLILWTLNKQIRILNAILNTQDNATLNKVFAQHQIWPSRQAQYQQWARKHQRTEISEYLSLCLEIDYAIKGIQKDNLTLRFNQLVLSLLKAPMPH